MTNVQIMMVENESSLAREIKDRLEGLGYTVSVVVATGEAALEQVAEKRPDLVLIDIRLKGRLDGVETAEQIRTNFDIPVIYLTASLDEHTLQRAKSAEPFGYILKPFEERELQTTVEMALYRHKLERKLKEGERWRATLLNSISDAVIATDTRGGITFMNPMAEALTGWSQVEALGKDLSDIFNIINEETHIRIENPVARVLREGTTTGLANHTVLIARNGTEVPIDDRAAPIKDDQGRLSGAVLIFRDITERRQAEAKILQRNRELLALQSAGAAIASSLDLQEVLTMVTGEMINLLQVEACAIFAWHQADNTLSLLASAGSDLNNRVVEASPDRLYYPADNLLTTQVLLERSAQQMRMSSVALLETEQPERGPAEFHCDNQPAAAGQTAKIKSLLLLPMVFQDRVVGLVEAMESRVERIFTEQEISLAQLLADQSAGAIENARLYQAERARYREAEALRQASAALSSTLKYEEVLDRILEQVSQVVPHDAANFMLIDGNIARIFRWRSNPQVRSKAFDPSVPFSIAETINLRTIQETGRPLAIPHVECYPGWVDQPDLAWMKSYAGAPIHIRDRVIGFLNVTSATPGFFSQADAERLQAFAYHAAIAIENARLHENLQTQLDALQKAQSRLVQSEKLAGIGELVAGVAHELNNPLTTVIGFAQLLQHHPTNTEISSDLDKIVTQAQRAANIVRGLLDFARQRSPERRPVQLNHVLQSTVDLLAYELRTHNVKVDRHFSSNLPLTMADPHQLQQVFVNLVNNARQALSAAHNGGHLTITSELSPSIFIYSRTESVPVIRVMVQDDGPGIPAEWLPRIFDPFFTTKPVGEGTGLGLSICHGIVTEHGGHIWAESEPGQGTTFFIELPVVTPPELSPANLLDSLKKPGSIGAARLLVIDDEVGILEMLALTLQSAGYQVDAVNDGAAGLACLAKTRYDLILCDVRMPGLNGLEIYRQVQAQDPELARRIIFITGDTVSPATRHFLDETGAAYLDKPFSLSDLVEYVRTALALIK